MRFSRLESQPAVLFLNYIVTDAAHLYPVSEFLEVATLATNHLIFHSLGVQNFAQAFLYRDSVFLLHSSYK